MPQWIKHGAVTPIWLLHVDFFLIRKRREENTHAHTDSLTCSSAHESQPISKGDLGWIYMQQMYWAHFMGQERWAILRHPCFKMRRCSWEWQGRWAKGDESVRRNQTCCTQEYMYLHRSEKTWGRFCHNRKRIIQRWTGGVYFSHQMFFTVFVTVFVTEFVGSWKLMLPVCHNNKKRAPLIMMYCFMWIISTAGSHFMASELMGYLFREFDVLRVWWLSNVYFKPLFTQKQNSFCIMALIFFSFFTESLLQLSRLSLWVICCYRCCLAVLPSHPPLRQTVKDYVLSHNHRSYNKSCIWIFFY